MNAAACQRLAGHHEKPRFATPPGGLRIVRNLALSPLPPCCQRVRTRPGPIHPPFPADGFPLSTPSAKTPPAATASSVPRLRQQSPVPPIAATAKSNKPGPELAFPARPLGCPLPFSLSGPGSEQGLADGRIIIFPAHFRGVSLSPLMPDPVTISGSAPAATSTSITAGLSL